MTVAQMGTIVAQLFEWSGVRTDSNSASNDVSGAVDVLLALMRNAHTVADSELRPLGRGVYPLVRGHTTYLCYPPNPPAGTHHMRILASTHPPSDLPMIPTHDAQSTPCFLRPQIACANHSCAPSAALLFLGLRGRLTALRGLSPGDEARWEEYSSILT